MPRFNVICVAALLAVFTASPASAQPACLPHAKLVDLLKGRYTEQRVAMGLESNGRLFEIFTSLDGATWTMVVTTPDSASCVVAAGLEWQPVTQVPPEEDAY